jgi:dGTPase
MYNQLISKERRGKSSIEGRTITEETASDHSRITFSSSMRRLQQKAQVFSLEKNASVRSRLTHSLEVADYGRLIAYSSTRELIKQGLLKEEYQAAFVNIVENACLLHDVGNLPFGHFGETAVQEWFKENWKNYYSTSVCKKEDSTFDPENLSLYMEDFLEFDGNPQGFRIITLLQQPSGTFKGTGLNLTCSQIYAFLKYLRKPGETKGDGILKKAGYFHSEKHVIDEIQQKLNHQGRYPLTYIMEAADDMSYCLSDIEDGVEKGILLIRDFFEKLNEEWRVENGDRPLPFDLGEYVNDEPKKARTNTEEIQQPLTGLAKQRKMEDRFFYFKVKTAQSLIEYAAETYVNRHAEILKGETGQLFDERSEAHQLLKALKNVAKKVLFRSREAENNELAGHAVIFGLLEKFGRLLAISKSDFAKLTQFKEEPGILSGENLDIELRLFNRLPQKYVDAYHYGIQEKSHSNLSETENEWFYRAHLIVDFVSGMTDHFSLELYKLLHGIEIG